MDYWNNLKKDISNKKLDVEVLQAKNRTFSLFLKKHLKNGGSSSGKKKKVDSSKLMKK